MEYLIDEEEIKVEYYENFDRDPLRLNRKDIKKEVAVKDDPEFQLQDTNKGLIIAKEEESKMKDDPCDSEFQLQNSEKGSIIAEVNDILWHKRVDNEKYICKFCDLSYGSIQTLRHHIKTKHAVQAKILKKNIAINKRKSILKCHICKIKFDYTHGLKLHLKVDHKIGEVSSTNRKNQSPKTRKVDQIGSKYQCPYCGQNLSRQHALKTHIILKHKEGNIKKYSCQFCEYKSSMSYYIEAHTSSKHPNTEYSRSFQKYFCDICGYQTLKKSHYTTHRKLHNHEKNFKCSLCDYATVSKSNLKVHLRLHSAEKPYICSEVGCGYKCSAKSALRSHEMRHNKEANYIYCDKCSYKTVYMQCLKRHYARHCKEEIQISDNIAVINK